MFRKNGSSIKHILAKAFAANSMNKKEFSIPRKKEITFLFEGIHGNRRSTVFMVFIGTNCLICANIHLVCIIKTDSKFKNFLCIVDVDIDMGEIHHTSRN